MKFSINSPVEIISGTNCVLEYDGYKKFGNKGAVITGKNMYKHCPAVNDVCEALKKNGIDYILITEAENNPSVASVFDFADRVNKYGAEFVVGIGGGSSMDTAKAVALVASNPGVTQETVFSYKYQNPPIPSIMVGTTAGTGSEVMPSSVLTESGDIPVKKSLKTHDSYAKVALCDYRYSSTMPDKVTVSTALDSICHSIEAIYNKKGGEWSRIYGQESLRFVIPALRAFVEKKGNIDEIREKLYFGSILAGLAINDGGTSLPHSMSYLLTTMHDAPHGFGCAVFLPKFMELEAAICDVSDTLKACGMQTVDDFCKEIRFYIDNYYKIPVLTEKQAKDYAAIAIKLNVNNNFLNISEDRCFEIYLEATRG